MALRTLCNIDTHALYSHIYSHDITSINVTDIHIIMEKTQLMFTFVIIFYQQYVIKLYDNPVIASTRVSVLR